MHVASYVIVRMPVDSESATQHFFACAETGYSFIPSFAEKTFIHCAQLNLV
jgi:hypothetical protein